MGTLYSSEWLARVLCWMSMGGKNSVNTPTASSSVEHVVEVLAVRRYCGYRSPVCAFVVGVRRSRFKKKKKNAR